MISLCRVCYGANANNYDDMSIETILKNLKHVSEIITFRDADSCQPDKEEAGVKLRNITYPADHPMEDSQHGFLSHAAGLEECVRHATKEYVMFLDNDVIVNSPIDELYLTLLNQHELKFVGVSHHISVNSSVKYFPTVISMLVRKIDLPPDNWLHNKDNGCCYLYGHHCDDREIFPNPQGFFDTGVFLWLWNEKIKGRWLSFQTTNVHVYTTRYHRSNFKFDGKIPVQSLLWHATGGSDSREPYWKAFAEQYELSKSDNENG